MSKKTAHIAHLADVFANVFVTLDQAISIDYIYNHHAHDLQKDPAVMHCLICWLLGKLQDEAVCTM